MCWGRKNRGIITVFVTLIMVPIVVCTGIFVDVARMKLYSSQAAMTADAYGEVVLSEYDNLLKELYGLFAVTQNDEALKELEKLESYVGYSFNPAGDGQEYNCTHTSASTNVFMPYASAEPKLAYEKVAGSDLGQSMILMSQVSEFMKFRIVEEVVEEGGWLDKFEQFENIDANMKAVQSRNEITIDSTAVLSEIKNYYQILKAIDSYSEAKTYSENEVAGTGYLEAKKANYEAYAAAINEIYSGEGTLYPDYVYYVENQEAVDAAVAKSKAIDEAITHNAEMDKLKTEREEEATANGTEPDLSDITYKPVETLASGEEYYCAIYEKVKDYKSEITNTLTTASFFAKIDAYDICFYDEADNGEDAADRIAALSTSATDMTTHINTLQGEINKIKENMPDCDKAVQEAMASDIATLEEITSLGPEFQKTYKDIVDNGNINKNTINYNNYTSKINTLEAVKTQLIEGTLKPGQEATWSSVIDFVWYDFEADHSEFYAELQSLCETVEGTAGDENAADSKIEDAEEKQETAESEMESEDNADVEKLNVRDISDNLAIALETGSNGEKIPGFLDYVKAGFNFQNVSAVANGMLGKFLLVSYDFGMFSSRVTHVKPPEEAPNTTNSDSGTNTTNVVQTSTEGGEQEEEYYEESLTKVKKSKEVNYLYGGELEYLFGGDTSSQDNLKKTRNVINAVRFTMNFTSTYLIDEINYTIEGVAEAAAAAVVAATLGLGSAAAPLVKIAVSGALRAAVAALETVEDWKVLKARQEVIFLKTRLDQLEIAETVADIIGKPLEKSGNTITEASNGFAMSYEDYLFVLLCFMVSSEDLTTRTGHLITLNVNQCLAAEGADFADSLEVKEENGTKTVDLPFSLSKACTAVEASCSVDIDFVVVPEDFMNMFISGEETEDAKNIIQKLDDSGYKYSVIRGY